MPHPTGRPMKTFRGDEVGEKKELEKMVNAGFETLVFQVGEKGCCHYATSSHVLNDGYRTYKTLIATVS